MRLYTMTGATQVSAGGTVYTGDENGVFEFPQDVGAEQHSFHVNGKAAWEDDAERAARLAAEQMEKLRDPATMLAELQKMTAGQGALASLLANALGAAQAAPAQAETSVPEAPSEPAPSSVAKSPRSRKSAASPAGDAPSA